MSLYGGTPPNGNASAEPQGPRAPQACTTCRKQKRKCSKTLPACALCERMNRHCDYSDSSPPPTSEDFSALQTKVMELESRLNGGGGSGGGNGGGGGMNQSSTYPTPSSSGLTGSDGVSQLPVYTPPQDIPWQGVQNRFPAIAFLDIESFKFGGISIPQPTTEIPVDVLEILGDGHAIQIAVNEYFSTVHKWMPIVSPKRLTQNMANPRWEAGPDLPLLFLCMKLITSKPQDGVECAHNPIYLSAKRFVALMEASGTASLLVLQANLLITWYEYGQAIYPAAWMSAGWCLRYGNMLGINGHEEAAQLLGPMRTLTEQEERRRTWWGVLLVDRIISLGSQGYIPNAQEPQPDDFLPVNDASWDNGEMVNAMQRKISSPTEEPNSPFPRLCQVSVMLGRVLRHRWGGPKSPDAKPHLSEASILDTDASLLAQIILDEANKSADYLSLAAPLALAFSTLCKLYDSYSCPKGRATGTTETAAMQVRAVDGLKSVSTLTVEFWDRINAAMPLPHDLDRINPIIMDALYSAASNYAWIVRESGDESSQRSLESIRLSLRRLGTRWRNAAEYLRILEAQEFTYAVGSAGSS